LSDVTLDDFFRVDLEFSLPSGTRTIVAIFSALQELKPVFLINIVEFLPGTEYFSHGLACLEWMSMTALFQNWKSFSWAPFSLEAIFSAFIRDMVLTKLAVGSTIGFNVYSVGWYIFIPRKVSDF